jgi:hypothetical protein
MGRILAAAGGIVSAGKLAGAIDVDVGYTWGS